MSSPKRRRTSSNSCFIIAEAGVNHNGSVEIASAMIEAASEAGADAVKFQTFRTDALVTRNAFKAEYQKRRTGEGTQYDMLHKLELSRGAHSRLAELCHQKGIEFMSTAFDTSSADLLFDLGVKRVKIPSGELTNLPLIQHLSEKDLPMILSTGMATMDEISEAVKTIRSTRECRRFAAPLSSRLTLLHCTSNYPVALADVNLNAMQTLSEHFGLPVGYSDHTEDLLVAPLAVAMGATIIEKHFTLDRSMAGPDHKASLEPVALKILVNKIRECETVLGSPEKVPSALELETRKAARRSLTVAHNLPEGHTLSKEDLVLLRPGTGIAPRDLDNVIGRRTRTELTNGHTLLWSDLAP